MPDSQESTHHVRPFVYDTLHSKALHFAICEVQSSMRLRDPDALDLEYTRMMMGFLLFMAEPQSITMIGLGGGSLAKFCYRHLPQTRILVVEINPHVIALRDEFHIPSDDDRFSVVRTDGAQYVRTSASPCDILMVDGYDSEGLPPRLCSQRFYDDGFALLRPGGIMVVNLQYSHDHYAIHLDRIRRSFGDSVLVAGDKDGCNSIVFARKGVGFAQIRQSAMRLPESLDVAAAAALLPALTQVAAASRQQQGESSDGIGGSSAHARSPA